jgi:hypothetical protein
MTKKLVVRKKQGGRAKRMGCGYEFPFLVKRRLLPRAWQMAAV